MSNNLISVIVPVYNVKPYLEQCVASICGQSYQNLEILLIDDGSTDGSDELCDTLAKQDDRIRVIHKPNGGLSDARNAGLDIATGDYVGYVDSDDYLEPGMFRLLLENALAYDADVSCCRYAEVYDDGTMVPFGDGHMTVVYDQHDALRQYLIGTIVDPFVCNKLYKADFTRKQGTGKPCRFTKGIFGEDIPFNLSVFKQARKVVTTGEALYNYRQQRKGALTSSFVSQKRIDSTFRWEAIRQDIRENFPDLDSYALRRQSLYYIGLYNRIILADAPYLQVTEDIKSFIKDHLHEITHGQIFEKRLKIAAWLLTKSPLAYLCMMKTYKWILGTTRF